MSIVETNYMNNGLASAAIAASGVLFSVDVGLFTNNQLLSHNSLIGNMTEPTYDGYARQAITWENQYTQPDGSYALSSQLVQFQMDNADNPCTAYGYFVCETSSGTPLVFAELFDAPKNLNVATDSILLSVQVAFGSSSDGSASVIV